MDENRPHYLKVAEIYVNEEISGMMKENGKEVRARFYLFGSRAATHILFWVGYYLLFSLVWMKPEQGYFASFYLEFVLLPPRVLAVYGMIYILLPQYLLTERYREFFALYAVLILIAALVQRVSGYFFYDYLLLGMVQPFFDLGALVQSVVLVNTTVVFVGAVKMYQFYLVERAGNSASANASPITVKSDRRMHLLQPDDILYIEGMGNYVTYHLNNGKKLVVYSSIKAALDELPQQFFRLHRSYILNRRHIGSFSAENVVVGDHTIPRGKDVPDELLAGAKG